MKKLLNKHLLLMMIALFTAVAFTGCKDDDDLSDDESKLVGTWVYSEYDDGDYLLITMDLKKKGKGTFSIEEGSYYEESDITWSVKGDNLLSIYYIDEDEMDTYPYTLSSNGKTLTWGNIPFKKK